MRCQIVPLPNDQVSFSIDGVEKTRWHFDPRYPRPFFYPIIGPSGHTLTRMGHPGAPDHDHHRSVWFAHHKLLGISFWSDNTDARITQRSWQCYEDGDQKARMAVTLLWRDGHDPAPLVTQQLIVTIRPLPEDEWTLEVQSTFTPNAQSIEFQQTNFGFFAVRVAKNISSAFGGGQITNSERQVGESNVFGKPARWMDYSGPRPEAFDLKRPKQDNPVNPDVRDLNDKRRFEGITYLDHPSNPGQPTKWHVRTDGWMGAAPCMDQSLQATKKRPIRIRYVLHLHGGKVNAKRADQLHEVFSARPDLRVTRSSQPGTQWEIGTRTSD